MNRPELSVKDVILNDDEIIICGENGDIIDTISCDEIGFSVLLDVLEKTKDPVKAYRAAKEAEQRALRGEDIDDILASY